MSRNYRKLETSQDLTRLMTRYYATRRVVGMQRPLAWVTSGAPVEILTAMGVERALANSFVRFSLGRASTAAEVAEVIRVLPELIERVRRPAAHIL